MKILIIDDSSYKIEAIKAILNSFDSSYEIDTAGCRNEGLRKLLEGYDLLILDNCFPVLTDSAPKKDMGLNVLRDLSLSMRFEEIRKTLKIIMCSSDEIDVSDFSEDLNILGCVAYDSSIYLNPLFEELLKKGGYLKDEEAMSLTEAIEHLDDVLADTDRWNGCEECMKEHVQLREWLIELQKYRAIGSLEDFEIAESNIATLSRLCEKISDEKAEAYKALDKCRKEV